MDRNLERTVQEELQTIRNWNINAFSRDSIILVPRAEATTCVEHILEEQHEFLGFDAFTLHQDGRIQPDLEYSRDYSHGTPPRDQIFAVLESAPEEITHFEFVIRLVGASANDGTVSRHDT